MTKRVRDALLRPPARRNNSFTHKTGSWSSPPLLKRQKEADGHCRLQSGTPGFSTDPGSDADEVGAASPGACARLRPWPCDHSGSPTPGVSSRRAGIRPSVPCKHARPSARASRGAFGEREAGHRGRPAAHEMAHGGGKHPWYRGTFARTALPMFGFVVLCWYGLEQLMSSKLKIRVRAGPGGGEEGGHGRQGAAGVARRPPWSGSRRRCASGRCERGAGACDTSRACGAHAPGALPAGLLPWQFSPGPKPLCPRPQPDCGPRANALMPLHAPPNAPSHF
jgi:hypothetical protein